MVDHHDAATLRWLGAHSTEAPVLGRDEVADVALIDAGPDDFLPNGRRLLAREGQGIQASTKPRPGDQVIAMGFPANKGLTVTTGTLNAVCVTIRNNCYLVSSADIDGGNSGGPLMTTQGNIIGMNTAEAEDGEWDGDRRERASYALTMLAILNRLESLKHGGVIEDPLAEAELLPRKTWPDGSFLAALTWQEEGKSFYPADTKNEQPCATRVTKTPYDDQGNFQVEWEVDPLNGLCHYTGIFHEEGIVVSLDGEQYFAQALPLSTSPYEEHP